ncbi:hypothetical protein I4U23_029725 [Adineta vaga]|nr:hypothetical protein I4U23_029725 [Adineta vaga]
MRNILSICLLLTIVVNGQSPCEQVPFVSRAEWGARPPNCYDDAACVERVKWIQDLHQNDREWVDIGYHFLVGENGKVYEGRGWDRQGAHAPGWNNDAFGICIIGDFRTESPNQKALDAVKLWIDCGVQQGHVKNEYYIITHRQSQRPGYTECPGNGTIDAIKPWPRYCSYQNSGANLTANETQISLGSRFCRNEIGFSSASFLSISILLSFISFLFVHYFIE